MRIVLLNQFYPPDRSPTARYLRDLAEALVVQGAEVEVLASRAYYRKGPEEDGVTGWVKVRRFWTPTGRGPLAKAVAYAVYYIQAATRLALGPRADLVLGLSSPPYLGLLARAFGKRHAHWVMDAYPQVLFASGALSSTSLLGSTLRQLARVQYRGAAAVFALGPDMARRLAPELDGRADIRPLWLPSDMPPLPKRSAVALARRAWGAAPGRRVLLYAGNLGRGHRYSEFVTAMRTQKANGPLWVFMGDGPGFPELAQILAAEPSLPLRLEAPCFGVSYAAKMAAADLHLVSLKEGWQGLIVPSKLQASLAAGKPVIFVGPKDCEPARWLAASGAGWIIPIGRLDRLRSAVNAPGRELLRRGKLGRVWALAEFHGREGAATMATRVLAASGETP